MDFSSLNPLSTNPLNLAARNNDVKKVEKLLKKFNPNLVDNRGWTCLHEAAARDSYECVVLILKHKGIRPLAETHEGHTALYLACRFKSSLQTIQALLDSETDIANYASTENVTPLHVVSVQGRIEVIWLLIQYGAMYDVQDFDGDTPLHDAALATKHEAVEFLLHAGANPEIKNESNYTPFHLACYKGCFQTVQELYPFITDINEVTINGDSPLILATQGRSEDVVMFLLKNGADPHIKNKCGDLALVMALNMGHNSLLKILLSVTSHSKIDPNIILNACKPHFFKLEILESLLTHDFGPEFFNFYEQFHVILEQIGEFRPSYITNAPINSYLNVSEYIYNISPEKFRKFFYLFLMRGLLVNAVDVYECPPLVYIHYSMHSHCFPSVFEILREHGCNVDYCSTVPLLSKDRYIPDAMLASLTSDSLTLLTMLPHSLYCDPEYMLKFVCVNGVLGRIPLHIQHKLIAMISPSLTGQTAESISHIALPLKHLCRQKVRFCMRKSRNSSKKTTDEFHDILNRIHLPMIIKDYLRYL